jgi:hypothetical protein
VIGTWIHTIATATGGDKPLADDYCKFKITAPSKSVKLIDKCKFGVNIWADCNWQITEKGSYLVEVWAYDKNGDNVKVPVIPNANSFMKSTNSDHLQATTSGTITVES